MLLAKRIRLKPTADQEKQLWQSAGTARWTYNWTLGRQKENAEKGNKFLSDNELRKEITQLKKQAEYKWLNEVSNNIPKQAVKDACNAYTVFFKRQNKFPKFKSRKKSKPSFYNDNGKLKVKKMCVLIEKVGWIKTSEQFPIDAEYKNPRVSFDGKYWYLSVGLESEIKQVELTNDILGIDLGLKELAICSDGQVFKNINKTKDVKKIEKRLRRLQRSASRKYENNKEGDRFVKTRNTIKIEKQIRILHRKLANIRNNHIHQSTNAIVKTKPCAIVMEDLNVTGMMKNRHLSKAIAKQCFHEFKRQVKYKCEKSGIVFMQVDRYFPSSKLCSSCGQIKKDLKLSDRTYNCDCGLTMDRDMNAALNLSNCGKLAV